MASLKYIKKHYHPQYSVKIISIFMVFSLLISCKKKVEYSEQELPIQWAKLTTYLLKNTPANTPTFASRTLGYIGLTMYESIVNGYPKYQSMEGQLNGLDSLPKPISGKKYDWNLSLNAGQAEILRNIYIQTSDDNKKKIDSVEQVFQVYYSEKISDKELIDNSIAYGKAVALRIFE